MTIKEVITMKKHNGLYLDFCVQQFPFIAEDFDSLTMYELVSRIGAAVNKLYETVADHEARIKELEEKINSEEPSEPDEPVEP